MKTTPQCPGCCKPLQAVRQDANSMLNAEQFDAARAGDWFCDTCKGEGARTGYRYFWDRDFTKPSQERVPVDRRDPPFNAIDERRSGFERRQRVAPLQD